MGHKKEVIKKLDEILANQELIMAKLGINNPVQEDAPPDEPPGNEDPPD
jgi:hypothetical protein